MPTALFVEQDARYIVTPQSMRFSCTREEWDNQYHRRDAIERAWALGMEAIRSDNAELVAPHPVTVFMLPSGEVLCADIRRSRLLPPHLVAPNGSRMLAAPPRLSEATAVHTTYKQWAEGPLPHLDMTPATTPLNEEDLQALAGMPTWHQNRALQSLREAGVAGEAMSVPGLQGKIDFRIRCFIKKRDIKILVSQQSTDGHKLVLDDGTVWDGRDGELAVED